MRFSVSLGALVPSLLVYSAPPLRTKRAKNKYAKVPPKRNPELIPWNMICIDLVGPYKIGSDKYSGSGKNRKLVEEAPKIHCLSSASSSSSSSEGSSASSKVNVDTGMIKQAKQQQQQNVKKRIVESSR